MKHETTNPFAKAWHKLVAEGNIDDLDNMLATNVVFHSPVVNTPQEGKRLTKMYLMAANKVLANESFHYVREISQDTTTVLEFVCEVEGITINGVDIISWNNDGQIIDFKVLIRPLKAINLLHDLMMEMLKTSGR